MPEPRPKEKSEKPKQAIALSYEPEDDAPKVIAAGKGQLAERIIERAKEADIPVHRDEKLAETLSRLDIGEMIPPALYEVVAEILIFVDAMDRIQEKAKKAKASQKL
jgi:flagellar biosynthesis protein